VVCGDLLVVEVASGEVRQLDLGGVDVSWTRFLDDTRLLAFGRRRRIQIVLEVELATGNATERWSTEETIGGGYHPSGTPTAEGFVTVVESHRRPPAVVEMRGGQERVLADLRHPGHEVAADALARREPRRWTSSDGLEIEGYLSLPHGDPPFPLALHVHGGPVGSVDDTFPGLLTALLLRRGFAIVDPNPRGSTGRGQAFIAGVVGDMGGMDLVDDLAGVDALVAEGVADPDRLVLFGGSYGGFMSAWISTQDPRFKAAVAMSPVTDWWSERFDGSLGAWVADFLGGDPDAIPEAYTARSPVLQAHRCRTPVLLTAGRNDRATPVGQAVEFYRALRERGVASEVVTYPEEGHGVSNLPAVLDLLTRTVAWFERFLPPSDGGPHPGLRRN
jgi:dipeptidyl aminopeptidase/acylaminoacyl peptidase